MSSTTKILSFHTFFLLLVMTGFCLYFWPMYTWYFLVHYFLLYCCSLIPSQYLQELGLFSQNFVNVFTFLSHYQHLALVYKHKCSICVQCTHNVRHPAYNKTFEFLENIQISITHSKYHSNFKCYTVDMTINCALLIWNKIDLWRS